MNTAGKLAIVLGGLLVAGALVYFLGLNGEDRGKPDTTGSKAKRTPPPPPADEGSPESVDALKTLLGFASVNRVPMAKLGEALEPFGGASLLHTPGFIRYYDGHMFLDLSDAQTVHSMIAIARRFRIVEAVPTLEKLLGHEGATEASRLAVLNTLFAIGHAETAKAELTRRIEGLEELESAEQEAVLGMTTALAASDAEAALQGAVQHLDKRLTALKSGKLDSEKVKEIGVLGHAHSVAKRYLLELEQSRKVEKAAETEGARPLVLEAVNNWRTAKRRSRAMRAIERMNLNADAIKVAKELEGTVAPNQVPFLLKIRDQLGDGLTAEETRKLESAFPSLPRDRGNETPQGGPEDQ